MESDCDCGFGSRLWSNFSFRAVPPIGVGGGCREPCCGDGVVFLEFVDRRLDRKKDGTKSLESVDRNGAGGMCGVLLLGGEGAERVDESREECKLKKRRQNEWVT